MPSSVPCNSGVSWPRAASGGGGGPAAAWEPTQSQRHLFQSLPRQPFKRGKSLEEPGLPPPEGAPRLVPDTQREPREKNGEAQWLWLQPEGSGPFPQGPEKRQQGPPRASERPPRQEKAGRGHTTSKISVVKTLCPNLTRPHRASDSPDLARSWPLQELGWGRSPGRGAAPHLEKPFPQLWQVYGLPTDPSWERTW